MNINDRLTVECALFYMGYVRSLGFIQETADAHFLSQRKPVRPARWLLYRLMCRDLNRARVKAFLCMTDDEVVSMKNYPVMSDNCQDEEKRATLYALTIAPPFECNPWPTDEITVIRQSKLNFQPLE